MTMLTVQIALLISMAVLFNIMKRNHNDPDPEAAWSYRAALLLWWATLALLLASLVVEVVE